jgi:hypothetical protein
MKLGPIQKQWIAALRDNPDQQITRQLGTLVDGQEYFCCLGKGASIVDTAEWKELEYLTKPVDAILMDGDGHFALSPQTCQMLGLYTELGLFNHRDEIKGRVVTSLYQMNDNGFTWDEIADYMEQHPENVFKESK